MSDHDNEHRPPEYPALRRLGFSTERLKLLERQGFISPEARRGRTVFRLRYRDELGQQRARNIPSADLAAVEHELAELQTARRIRRQLGELERAAQQLKCDRKRLLTPLVLARGLRFHGGTIRAPRWQIVHRER